MVIDNNKQEFLSDMQQSSVSRSLQYYYHVLGGLGVQTLTLK